MIDSAMLAGFPALACPGYVVFNHWSSGVIKMIGSKIVGRVVNLGILIKRTQKKR